MARGRDDRDEALQPRMPAPIAQRLRGLVDDLKVIQLLLDEVSLDAYEDALHSRNSTKIARTAYPLERAFEVASNYVVELAELALKELRIAPADGPSNLRAIADEHVITERMARELIDVHRARNGLQHAYPDLRAPAIYRACEQLAKLTPPFLRAYSRWLQDRGYGNKR